MDPYAYGYIGDAGYGGGGYVVEAGLDSGYGYGPQIIEYAGHGPQYVEEYAPQPYLVEEEIYAPAYLEPYGIEQQFIEPNYGYEEAYLPGPYIDGLVDIGYNGPWPADYYNPYPPPQPRNPCHRRGCERSCRCRPRHHRCESSDSDSSDDEHHHHHKHVHKHCHPMRRNNGNGVTKSDIQTLLDKFESALSLKYKRAQVTELEAENHVLKSLAREKREIQKQVAQNKRDLLLKEALDFNRAAPIPGRRQGQGQQVVSIDFGNQGQQPPMCPPGTRSFVAPPRPAAANPPATIMYH